MEQITTTREERFLEWILWAPRPEQALEPTLWAGSRNGAGSVGWLPEWSGLLEDSRHGAAVLLQWLLGVSIRHTGLTWGITCLRMRKVVPSAIWPMELAGWYRASDICHTQGCSHIVTSPLHQRDLWRGTLNLFISLVCSASRVKENGDCEKSFSPFRYAKYVNIPDVPSSSCLMASNSLRALSPPIVLEVKLNLHRWWVWNLIKK